LILTLVGLDAVRGLPVTPRGHYTHLPTLFEKRIGQRPEVQTSNKDKKPKRAMNPVQETSPALEEGRYSKKSGERLSFSKQP
jgi:hypothetical protein